MFVKIRAKLTEDWRELRKKSSIWFAFLFGMLQLNGPILRDWWTSMPDELKQVIPANFQVAIKYALLFGSLIALRYVKISFQRRTSNDDRSNLDTSQDVRRPDPGAAGGLGGSRDGEAHQEQGGGAS